MSCSDCDRGYKETRCYLYSPEAIPNQLRSVQAIPVVLVHLGYCSQMVLPAHRLPLPLLSHQAYPIRLFIISHIPMLLCIAPGLSSSVPLPLPHHGEGRRAYTVEQARMLTIPESWLIPGSRAVFWGRMAVIGPKKFPRPFLLEGSTLLPPMGSGCLICWQGCQGGYRGGAGVVYTLGSGSCSPLFLISQGSSCSALLGLLGRDGGHGLWAP